MNKGKIFENCQMIYSVFDDLESMRAGCEVKDGGEIRAFIFDLLNEDKKIRSITEGKLEEAASEQLTTLECQLIHAAFGLGYAVGNLFDSSYPKVRKAVEEIQSLLKERALLPYFSRERKAKAL